MIHPNITIDKESGQVTIPNFVLSSSTKIEALPDYFIFEKELEHSFKGTTIPIRFFVTNFVDKNIDLKIYLRFENNILVKIFFALTDNTKKYKALDFYKSVAEREALHLAWLKEREFENILFSDWGSIGMGRDKSEQVFIYMDLNEFRQVK